jgi:hypothetical protein
MAGKSVERLILILLALGLGGCAQVNSTPNGGQTASANSGTVTLFLRTTKAAGPTALKMAVSGLSMGDSSGNPVAVLGSVMQPEVRHMELAPTMLAQAAIPAGNFSNIVATVANPELSVVDAQGNITHLTGTTTPSVKLAVSAVNIAHPLSLAAKGSAGVMLDIDLEQSISRDGSGNYVISPMITATQVDSAQPGESLVDDIGTITNVSSGAAPVLNMKLQSSGSNVTIDTNGETLWSADITQLSNLQAGQSIEITADMESSGSYLAKFVGSSTAELPTTYEGLLTKAMQDSSGNTSITVAVQR